MIVVFTKKNNTFFKDGAMVKNLKEGAMAGDFEEGLATQGFKKEEEKR